jgi:carbamoyltransferase
MLVMGISCFYHDSAVALVDERGVRFAVHEERLSRVKHDARFPFLAVGHAMQAAGITSGLDIDRVVFYEDPWLKLRRQWAQAIDFWPHSRRMLFEDMPRLLQHKMPEQFLRSKGYIAPIEFSEHHRSHAASAFFTSPFERAVVVTLDGVGEFETAAVHLGEGNKLTKIRSIHFPHSLGLLYSVFTQYLGFEVNEGEYKVMGLAPYGEPSLVDHILGPLLRLSDDGSFALNLDFFDFSSRHLPWRPNFERQLGVPPRGRDDAMTQAHCDLAASIQRVLEQAIANMLEPLIREFATRDFCFAGGVALNCTANAEMIRRLGIRSHIHPAAGDAGGAIGAALQSILRDRQEARVERFTPSAYLGVHYPEAVIAVTLSLNQVPYRRSAAVAEELAERLAAGQVVGIVQGRDEWGPRALGGRSILADPRSAAMKDHLNARIKFREEFRPFAPVVKKEVWGDWFETLGMTEAPHMLYAHKALQPERTAATTHVDGTSRVQTVSAEQNPYLWRILDAFEQRTGVPVLINTSFNLRGEPIVSSPSDALKTFYASGIDCLAIEDFIVDKQAAGEAGPG